MKRQREPPPTACHRRGRLRWRPFKSGITHRGGAGTMIVMAPARLRGFLVSIIHVVTGNNFAKRHPATEATGVRRPQDQSGQRPQGTRNRKRPPGCLGHGTVKPLGEGLLAAHAVLVRRRAGFLAGVSPGFKRHDGHGDQHAAACEHAGNERDEQDLEDGFHGRMAFFLYGPVTT